MSSEEIKELLMNENIIAALVTSFVLLCVSIWIWIKSRKKKLSNE